MPKPQCGQIPRNGRREGSCLRSVTSSSPASSAFLKDSYLGERHVGSAMDYTTLQKLGSTKKYSFKEDININGLDELSRRKKIRLQQKMMGSSNWKQTEHLPASLIQEYIIELQQPWITAGRIQTLNLKQLNKIHEQNTHSSKNMWKWKWYFAYNELRLIFARSYI